MYEIVFFFFQAEDGIRDYKVTGVQTCALPISLMRWLTHSTSPTAACNCRISIKRRRDGRGSNSFCLSEKQRKIGRASCRERVKSKMGDGAIKKKIGIGRRENRRKTRSNKNSKT